jgi:hypothetical protein
VTVEALLDRLQGVRPRGQGRWAAKCPAHADRNPSLSIREGERGILLRCFAGCDIQTICAGLGISQSDLFFDARIDPEAKRQRDAQRRERERQRQQDGLRLDACREAEATIAAAREIDISRWSDDQLNDALGVLADAYVTLEREGVAHE